jgi:hypothetical protein
MKTILSVLFATALVMLGMYVFQDGAGQAGRHFGKLVHWNSPHVEAPQAAPTTTLPAVTPAPTALEIPAATPAPQLPTATPVIAAAATPTPAPVAVAATPPPAATPDPYEPRLILQSLSKSREEWPRQVALKRHADFPVVINGTVAGSIDVPPATAVNLYAVNAERVTVTFQGASQELGVADTDLIERVQSNRRQGIIPNKPKVIAVATPAASSTPAPTAASNLLEGAGGAGSSLAKAALPPSVAALVKEAEALAPNPKCKFEVDDTLREEWKDKAKRYMELPPNQVTAHPAAARFPGAVPIDARRLKREYEFPLNLPRWQSTGLYAAPGEKITVQVSPQDAKRGLSIVIGAHRDGIFARDKWSRFPIISRTFKITEPHTVAANAFGGLIYIDIPRDKAMGGYNVPTYGGYGWLDEHPEAVHGSVHVTIEGAVEAPLYRAGQTTAEQWQKMQQLQAPWGELASDHVILALPMDILKTVRDPAPVLAYWDKVTEAEDELVGWPKRSAPPERIVPDLEISAGFMHSGYPVMCYMVSAAELVDLKKLSTEGAWGFFHELGHNHEAQAATFGSDYVEVNVNFCSLYCSEKVVGHEMTAGHGALSNIDKLLHERLGSAKKSEAFQNLAMYVLPIKALGWDAFHKTIASYSTSDGAKGIKTREDKMDQWVLRYSQATGKNLAPYFAAFDVTCSDKTKEALKSLPVWLPTPDFPKNYQ